MTKAIFMPSETKIAIAIPPHNMFEYDSTYMISNLSIEEILFAIKVEETLPRPDWHGGDDYLKDLEEARDNFSAIKHRGFNWFREKENCYLVNKKKKYILPDEAYSDKVKILWVLDRWSLKLEVKRYIEYWDLTGICQQDSIWDMISWLDYQKDILIDRGKWKQQLEDDVLMPELDSSSFSPLFSKWKERHPAPTWAYCQDLCTRIAK